MNNQSAYLTPRNILRFFVLMLLVTLFPLQPAVTYAAPAVQDDNLPVCLGAVDIPLVDPPCKDIQIVFIIDDSGSMGRAVTGNDLNGVRFESLVQTVDRLADFYLTELEARARVLPVINIAAIHFATNIDFNSGWVQIAPRSRASWERAGGEREILINEKLITDAIRDIVYNIDRNRRTDFRNPFREAADLLSAIEPPDSQGCPNRLVFVLTDGAPDEGNGELHRFFPASRAKALLDAHFVAVRQQAARIDSPIYVLAFRHSDRSYWDATEASWKDQIATDALQVEVGNRVDTGEIPNLLEFVRVKVEQSLVGSTYDVPAYVDSLEITYQAPNALASLQILDPLGNQIVSDGEKVTLTGEGTVDQVWIIADPLPGEYVFKPLDAAGAPLPGGAINLRFNYPAVEGMKVVITSAPLQQFTRGDVRFQLQDAGGNPIQFQPDNPPRFAVTFNPAGGEPQHLDLNPSEGEFSLPDVLPVNLELGTVDVSVVAQDYEGNQCVLYRGVETDIVNPVRVIAQPVDPQVCTPSRMPVRFPLTLVDVNDNPTSISLPVAWQVLPEHELGSRVAAEVRESGSPGAYEFSLDTQQAGKIVTNVSASVEHAGVSYELYEEAFETTHLIQDRSYAFELTGISTAADSRSVQFNQWFGQLSQAPYGQLLIGRRWFGWDGPQEIRVSGRFIDQDTGASLPGIERYLVELVPAGGGAPVAASNRWQASGDGAYTITFSAPPLGDYDLLLTDQAGEEACTLVAPVSGASLSLIRDYWEYIFIILLIILLLILLLLLILWLLCVRGNPLIVYFEHDGQILSGPAGKEAHVLAHLKTRHGLYVMEDYRPALEKVEHRSGWLRVYTQVEGFVASKVVCDADGERIIRIGEGQQVTVQADSGSSSKTLLVLSHAAPVAVLESRGEWLKVYVTVSGFVEASKVEPPDRALLQRCYSRPLYVEGAAGSVLRDAPNHRATECQVAALGPASRLVVMEDEVHALQKLKRDARRGWLLVQTRTVGYLANDCLSEDERRESVVRLGAGETQNLYALTGGKGEILLALQRTAIARVIERGAEWTRVEARVQGYIPTSQVSQPTKSGGNRRWKRPLLDAGQVERVDDCDEQPPTPDDLKILEGIGPQVEIMLNEMGIKSFEQLAAAAPRIGELERMLVERRWYYMLPETWPNQARMAAQAKANGENPATWAPLVEYQAFLKGGRKPEPNDLDRIEGISPEVELLLRSKGLDTFAQLASGEYKDEIVTWLDEAGIRPHHFETWAEQARLAAAADWLGLEEFKKRLRAE